jgi:hypothetical protein
LIIIGAIKGKEAFSYLADEMDIPSKWSSEDVEERLEELEAQAQIKQKS